MAQDDTEKLRARIEGRHRAVEEADYFAVLGLDDNASKEDVQQAYFKLAKEVHPDKIAARSDMSDLQEQARAVFEFATEAQEVLSDPKRREAYVRGDTTPSKPRTSRSGGQGSRADNADEIAKIAAHKGNVMLKKRAWSDAEQYFRQAIDARPDVVRYWQSLGLAVFHDLEARSEDRRLEEARKCWEKALELDADDAQTHYYLALYHKQRGNMPRCRSALQKALKRDPKHVDARREQRLLDMREARRKRNAGGQLKRFFDRLRQRLPGGDSDKKAK